MFKHRGANLMLTVLLLLLLGSSALEAMAGGDKVVVVRKPVGSQSAKLQIYNPPLRVGDDLQRAIPEEFTPSTGIAGVTSCEFNGQAGDELVLVNTTSYGNNGLYVYGLETGATGGRVLRTLASDSAVDSAVQGAAAGNFDADPRKELAVVTKSPTGVHSLQVYKLPAGIGVDTGPAVARAYNLGQNFFALSAVDINYDQRDELVIVRRKWNNHFTLEVCSPPGTLNGRIGAPLVSYADVGTGIVAVTAGDFDGDLEPEIGLVRLKADRTQSLEIYGLPRSLGESVSAPVASDLNIGADVVAIAAFNMAVSTPPPGNQPPTARISVSASKGTAPLAVSFNGSASRDADGVIRSYAWNFGNGHTASGATASYTYNAPGVYGVTLKVTDDKGAQGTAQVSIQVLEAGDGGGGGGTLLAQEKELISLINQQRQAYHLPPLTTVSTLSTAARRHSQDMARNGFLSHTGSDGSTPWTRMSEAGYPSPYVGENVAAGYGTPQATLDAWMSSPGHRANILSAGFCELGVGYAYGSGYGHYWTLDLGCR